MQMQQTGQKQAAWRWICGVSSFILQLSVSSELLRLWGSSVLQASWRTLMLCCPTLLQSRWGPALMAFSCVLHWRCVGIIVVLKHEAAKIRCSCMEDQTPPAAEPTTESPPDGCRLSVWDLLVHTDHDVDPSLNQTCSSGLQGSALPPVSLH